MRPAVFVGLVVVAAFLLRVGFTVAHRGGLTTPPDRRLGADSLEFDQLAQSLARGEGYRLDTDSTLSSFRAPGFPFFLAGLYTLFGVSYPAAYLSFAAWGAAGVVAAYLLCWELAGPRYARWAAVFAAGFPADVFMCSWFFTEVLFAPCLGFGLWFLVRHKRSGSTWAAIAAGVILGYATLVRPFAILFLPLYFGYIQGWKFRGGNWRGAIAFGLAFMIPIIPWTVRNYAVHGKFVLIATNGGSTFYGSNNPLVVESPRYWGDWVSTRRLPGRDLIEAQPDEVSHDKMEWKLGLDWVKEHPGQFVFLTVCKVARCWLPFTYYPSFRSYLILNVVSTTPLIIVILIGLVRTLRTRVQRQQFAVLHLAMLANLAMVIVFWGGPRFRDTNVPVLAIYGVLGIDALLTYIRRRREKDVGTGAG